MMDLENELRQLHRSLKERQDRFAHLLEYVHPDQHLSAVNLLHYLCIRELDLSVLQENLHRAGLSTLLNSEGYIESQLKAVYNLLTKNTNGEVPAPDYQTSRQLLDRRTEYLFGKRKEDQVPAIMVTFKSSFAHDFITVKKLLKAGMNIARINCAHDDEKTWLQMIKTVREVSMFTGIPCKVYMDLAGPKMRTVIGGKNKRIEVEEEDIILLTDKLDKKSKIPVVGCTIPDVAGKLKQGDRVIFDDGLIESRVVEVKAHGAELEITQVASKKPYLKSEKGINLPDAEFHLSALSDFDRKCIPFIMEHADLLGYSFIHTQADLRVLYELLQPKKIPVILKIETPTAFREFPDLLFTAMREACYGVMIARGDLAVELGFENISGAQDAIFEICRAAHVPVIFATQILENMNKKGLPTRAEITDASYGMRADCLMLNKGVHTAKVIAILKKILYKKANQLNKNYPVYRPLRMAKQFFERREKESIVSSQ